MHKYFWISKKINLWWILMWAFDYVYIDKNTFYNKFVINLICLSLKQAWLLLFFLLVLCCQGKGGSGKKKKKRKHSKKDMVRIYVRKNRICSTFFYFYTCHYISASHNCLNNLSIDDFKYIVTFITIKCL